MCLRTNSFSLSTCSTLCSFHLAILSLSLSLCLFSLYYYLPIYLAISLSLNPLPTYTSTITYFFFFQTYLGTIYLRSNLANFISNLKQGSLSARVFSEMYDLAYPEMFFVFFGPVTETYRACLPRWKLLRYITLLPFQANRGWDQRPIRCHEMHFWRLRRERNLLELWLLR